MPPPHSTSPDVKAQLEAQKQQCVFCKLVKKEIPGKIVFEDGKTIALLDIYPAVKGHTLFMPKEHYPLLPYLPPQEFTYLFGILPQLCKAVQSAMVAPSVNIFIANGGVAGQQSYHFLMHLLPRELGDGFFHFLFRDKSATGNHDVQKLSNTLRTRMNTYFSQNKSTASWHTGSGETPTYLKEIKDKSTILYEDEKVFCVVPNKGLASGQIELYSKIEQRELGKLSAEDSAHFFLVISFSASAVFESLGAQGTNIIVKSGMTDDHASGKLCAYILPRKQNDGLDSLLWQPKQPSYDIDGVAGRIKDKTWKVKFSEKKEEIKSPVISGNPISSHDEIKKALEKVKKG